ncbi:MAG: hypothetical protein PHP29_02650 [Tissierellia bacterium]|nr:hypothetical protein [Tissierellia bacterium]
MKKKTKFIWILIVSLLLIVAGYMRYYPIKHELLELRHIIEDKFDVIPERFTSIGLNNKDFYYFVEAEDNIAVVRMKMGMFNRFRYQGMSYTGANFVNGVVESKQNKYLLVGGKNPNHEIEKISFTLDNIPYEIDLVNPGDTFFEYIQIDNKTFDDHIFLNNTILYNGNGEDITDTIDTSSGGV